MTKSASEKVEQLSAEERAYRRLVAVLAICATGRRTASASLCGEAQEQLVALRAALDEAEVKLERAGGALDIAAATLNIVAWDEGFTCFDDVKWEMVNDALDVTRVASAELKWPRGIGDER